MNMKTSQTERNGWILHSSSHTRQVNQSTKMKPERRRSNKKNSSIIFFPTIPLQREYRDADMYEEKTFKCMIIIEEDCC